MPMTLEAVHTVIWSQVEQREHVLFYPPGAALIKVYIEKTLK